MEKLEPLYTIVGNVKYCKLYRKQYGVSSAVWSSNPTRVYFHKKLKARSWINNVHIYGHCSIIPSWQDVEAI